MASEIRVNKINSRTGVGTITLSPTGVDFTGIATVATLKATTGIVTTLTATTGIVTTLTVDTARTTTGIVTTLTADTSRITTGIVTTLTADTAKVGAAVTISESGMEVTGVTTVTSSINIGSATTISSSSLEVNGVQYPTAGALSNRNLIINGAMNVAQRGTSSTTNGYGSVDRFFIQWDGGTTTHTQTAITSGSPYDEGFRNVLRLTNTATGNGAGNYRNPFQYIEAQNLAQSGWNYTSSSSYVTLSFWVRSSVAQEFFGYLRTFDGTEQGYSFSLGTLSANTWTKVTKVIPGNSNITINNDAGTGLQVNIAPFWGADFTDSGNTTESWGAFSSGSRTPVYTDTWANTTDATFDITGVQLEVGEKATPFEHRSFGDDLAKCMRYFQKSYNYSDAPGSATSTGTAWLTVNQGGGRLVHTVYLKERMRATPTFKTYDWAGNIDKIRTQSGNNQNASQTYSSENAVIVDKNDSSLTENIFQYTVEAEL